MFRFGTRNIFGTKGGAKNEFLSLKSPCFEKYLFFGTFGTEHIIIYKSMIYIVPKMFQTCSECSKKKALFQMFQMFQNFGNF